jgi:methionine-R-sulfoxide reductase
MNFSARLMLMVAGSLIAAASWNVWAEEEKSALAGADASVQAIEGSGSEKSQADQEVGKADEPYVPKTKRELQSQLTRLQFDVTQNEATEPAFKNTYWNNKKEGVYTCIVCGRDLFSSKTKYDSKTGWPSFYAPIDPKHVGTRTDYRLFFARTEVHCSRCNAHLGHVFDDGPQPTGLRYCMNSASLKFVEKPQGKPGKQATGDVKAKP